MNFNFITQSKTKPVRQGYFLGIFASFNAVNIPFDSLFMLRIRILKEIFQTISFWRNYDLRGKNIFRVGRITEAKSELNVGQPLLQLTSRENGRNYIFPFGKLGNDKSKYVTLGYTRKWGGREGGGA